MNPEHFIGDTVRLTWKHGEFTNSVVGIIITVTIKRVAFLLLGDDDDKEIMILIEDIIKIEKP